MTDLPAGLRPLPYDAAAAAAAIDACLRAASIVAEAAETRLAAARVAQADWKGRYRDEFDRELAAITHEAADLEAALRMLAGDIRRTGDEVRMQNAARAERRRVWEREHGR